MKRSDLINIRDGLAIGLGVGITDVVVFKFVLGFPVSLLDALGAITFWIAAGLLVHTSSIRINAIVKGALIALVMGITWLVDAVNRGKPEETVVLVGIFLVFGSITGFVSGKVSGMSSRRK